jgi:hypothetical protein
VVSRLRAACASPNHEFWDDSTSLLDEALYRPEAISGHKQVTDVYLLGLAVRHQGRLATFDRSIPLKAVRGARADHLVVVGSGPTASS